MKRAGKALCRGQKRTFFFFNYEGSREGVPRAFVSSVPTALERQGDFSQTQVRLANGTAAPVVIYDPATTGRRSFAAKARSTNLASAYRCSYAGRAGSKPVR
jgi:hypothetical protein